MPCNETTFVLIFAATAAFFCILSIFLCIVTIKKSKELKRFRNENALFLSSAAHDLKSPLTNIKGYADAMLSLSPSPSLSDNSDSSERNYALSVISFEAERLSKIAGRLSDGLGTEKSRYKLSMGVFGICDTLHYVGLLLEKKAGMRNIDIIYSFSAEDEIYVFADKDAIIEVLYNLLDNAVKYSVDGEKIEITANPNLKRGLCTVTLRNTAYISYDTKTDNTKYFKPGVRGAEQQTKTQGHGLGLYIARELINAHGKKLDLCVTPQTDQTVNFNFSFCLDLAPDESSGEAK